MLLSWRANHPAAAMTMTTVMWLLPLLLLQVYNNVAGAAAYTDQQCLLGQNNTETDVLGPFYVANSPQTNVMAPESELQDDPSLRLYVSGMVIGTVNCRGISNVVVEVWYSGTGNTYYEDNYRGQVITDECGKYNFTQRMPTQYPARPILHDHFRLSRYGNELLVTQMYFAGTEPGYCLGTPGYCSDTQRALQVVEVQLDDDTGAKHVEFNMFVDIPGDADDNDVAGSIPECVVTSSTMNLPIGAECQENSECASDLCFSGGVANGVVAQEESTTTEMTTGGGGGAADNESSGSCACNPITGAGCQTGETCLWPPVGQPLGTPPICTSLLPLGSECQNNDECASENCFYGYQLPESPGRCRCNLDTNAGCDVDDNDEVCYDDPRIADEPPECIQTASKPIGSTCQVDPECASNHCFYGFRQPPSCQCNSQTNAGCDTGETCSNEPTYVDGLPECRPTVDDEDFAAWLLAIWQTFLDWLFNTIFLS